MNELTNKRIISYTHHFISMMMNRHYFTADKYCLDTWTYFITSRIYLRECGLVISFSSNNSIKTNNASKQHIPGYYHICTVVKKELKRIKTTDLLKKLDK